MKQAIVARGDLGMDTGKLAAQVAHASLSAVNQVDAGVRRDWETSGAKKIVLRVNSEAELIELLEEADRNDVPAALVRDAGRTQLSSGTATAVGVGPGPAERVDAVTGHLPLY